MVLFRAIHATKVLALAGLVIATSCIPLEARDRFGAGGVQTRTFHNRMYSGHSGGPRHEFGGMRYSSGWNGNRGSRRDWASNGGPPEVETRTRHNRLPHYRPYPGPYSDRFQHRGGWGRDRAGRDVWTAGGRRDGRPGIYEMPPEVETRTRHVRLPDYRPYAGPYIDRGNGNGGWVRDRAGREIWTSGGQRRNDYRPGIYGGDEFPDIIPGIGTYVGGISAYVDVGNGIYFSQEGDYRYADEGDYAPPPRVNRGKIINVTPQTMNRSCTYEHGVCVIRR
ncbi:MAG TPA: hypothetical protein VGO04_11885 [Ensifer sp.]|jgi:hypothetical protein|uniref:hypothetical protein n=1 Tax=Ensifer sp. TaxID=1872086 RepID=UPI002E0D6D50|nr:hypothetical protein [Ensifer sp.]